MKWNPLFPFFIFDDFRRWSVFPNPNGCRRSAQKRPSICNIGLDTNLEIDISINIIYPVPSHSNLIIFKVARLDDGSSFLNGINSLADETETSESRLTVRGSIERLLFQFLDACEKFGIVNVERSQNTYVGALVLRQALDYRERPFYQLLLRASVSTSTRKLGELILIMSGDTRASAPLRFSRDAPDKSIHITGRARAKRSNIEIAAEFRIRANLQANEDGNDGTDGLALNSRDSRMR